MDALPVEYLKGVMEKMVSYGDRVQFSLISPGPQPNYQITNTLGKTMVFDKNHHLVRPQDDEFSDANTTQVFTLDQVKARISGIGIGSTARTRTVRAARTASGGNGSGGRTSAAKLDDQFATQRYEYFKANRQTLPPAISEHSEEITELMKKGKSAEEAFGEVVKKYF